MLGKIPCNQPIFSVFQAPVAHAITAILWLTAFLTSASSTCAASIKQGGSCAAAILADLATAGSTIYGFDEDCYLTNPRETSWRPGFLLKVEHLPSCTIILGASFGNMFHCVLLFAMSCHVHPSSDSLSATKACVPAVVPAFAARTRGAAPAEHAKRAEPDCLPRQVCGDCREAPKSDGALSRWPGRVAQRAI